MDLINSSEFGAALTTRVAIAVACPDARFVDVNDAFCRFLGRSRSELLRLRIWDVTHATECDRSRRFFQQLVNLEVEKASLIKRYVRSDGKTVPAFICAFVAPLGDPPHRYLVALVSPVEPQFGKSPTSVVLRSWKEIAAFLNVSVRTAQIWEREMALPVRRVHAHGGVFAETTDLEQWVKEPGRAR